MPSTLDQRKTRTGDALLTSMLVLGAATLLQRAVGATRNVIFCGILEDAELGRWSLTYSFLLMAAPLVVLGIPCSFGRYVEYYRHTGQLRTFLIFSTFLVAVMTAAGMLVMLFAARPLSSLLYGNTEHQRAVWLAAASLGAIVLFNLVVEILTAFREVRYASVMQFVSSLGFASVGVVLLLATPLREEAVIIAFGSGALAAVILGLVLLARVWKLHVATDASSQRFHYAHKILPFAAWLWLGNLVSNLFEMSDQFMLRNFSSLPTPDVYGLIGQYYTSRVIPVLVVSFVCMASASLLPHLSHDWERGARDRVVDRLNLVLKLFGFGLAAGGAVLLILADPLFTRVLADKYVVGQQFMGSTMVYCCWYSLTILSFGYLLCAEQAKLTSCAFAIGLCVNLILNYFLAPHWGLAGVITATCVANIVTLGVVAWLCARHGMKWDASVLLTSLLPAALFLGAAPAAAIVSIVAWLAIWRGWLLTKDERTQIAASVSQFASGMLFSPRRLGPIIQERSS